MSTAYLGLGANLGEPRRQIERAITALGEAGNEVLEQARWYRSAPLGPPGQPDYLNTAVRIATPLSPLQLLDQLKEIERRLGRTEGLRWGPRVIDLDILLYEQLQLSTERLEIPHRELRHRRFVLAPLADLAPARVVPGLGKTVAELLAELTDDPASVEVLPS